MKQVDSARLYALKMGFDTVDIQSEINVLKALQRQGKRLGSAKRDLTYLVEVDDYSLQGREIPFYVMRYIKGEPLRVFLSRRGSQWLDVAGLNLLRQLRSLHVSGWVFGDLKPENVLVGSYGEVELIDYGGVSGMGRSVKQFTEWYDRGFWNAGGRTAEASYDWFSFAVVCIHLLAEQPLKQVATQLPQMRSSSDLLNLIRTESALERYREWLRRAVEGEFQDTAEACLLWKELVLRPRPEVKKKAATPVWIISAFAVSVTLLIYSLYLALRF
ncbi:Serine/threonine-protein kinase PknL [compost metagenome]